MWNLMVWFVGNAVSGLPYLTITPTRLVLQRDARSSCLNNESFVSSYSTYWKINVTLDNKTSHKGLESEGAEKSKYWENHL